jgi:hypothetical protein
MSVIIQHKLQDDAGTNRHQNVVTACLNPMVTTGWSAQVVAAPVIDHILSIAIFGWKAIAPMEFTVWAGAMFIPSRILVVVGVICALPESTAIRQASLVVATILLIAALHLFIATAIVTISIILAEGKSSGG